jgi:hypothetical protein
LFNDYRRCSFAFSTSKIGRAKLGAIEELLSLFSRIAPVLSQAPERCGMAVGLAKTRGSHEWLKPGAWGCKTKGLAAQSAEAALASFLLR